jgi:hypothetical protein
MQNSLGYSCSSVTILVSPPFIWMRTVLRATDRHYEHCPFRSFVSSHHTSVNPWPSLHIAGSTAFLKTCMNRNGFQRDSNHDPSVRSARERAALCSTLVITMQLPLLVAARSEGLGLDRLDTETVGSNLVKVMAVCPRLFIKNHLSPYHWSYTA